jgi:hypothetical protein
MFRQAAEELQRWLATALDCPVVITSAGQPAPSSGAGSERVVLSWLGLKNIAVQPLEHSTRISAQLEYLVYLDGGDALEGHARLEALLVAAALSELRCSPTPTNPEWWSALGMPLRPSVSIIRDVAVETAQREVGPPMREVIANTLVARRVSGRVVSASGEACAGVTVRVAGMHGSAVTGNDGRFRVLASAGEARVSLRLAHPVATELQVQLDPSE